MTDSRGDVTAEVVVLMPVLVLVVMVCVQLAAWSHAATIATSVAARAAQAEARHGSVPGDAEREAASLFQQLQVTPAAPVSVQRSPTLVTTEVVLAVPAVVPGLLSEVRRRVAVVRERVIDEGLR